MLRFFDPSQLPVEYGGTMEVDWEPMQEGEPLSSEVTLNTAEEDPEEEITAMIREFKEEEESHREHPEAGGSSSGTHHSSRSAEFAHLGAELDAMD